MLAVNLTGAFLCTRAALPDMIERKWGRVINVSSVNGQKGAFGQTNYSAAKAGMHGFTMAMAREVAAAIVLSILPVFALALYAQRYLVEGLSLGAVKG